MPKHKDFKFPEKLLSQINECSGGGFCIFTFDEYGKPQVYSQFDNPIYAMAMQYYIENWTAAVSNVQLNTFSNAVDRAINPESGDGSEKA